MVDVKKRVKIELIGDNTKLDKSLKSAEKSTKNFGISIKKALAVGTAAVAGLGAAAIKMVGDFKAADQVFRQTEATIRATGGAAGLTAQQVADMATAFQRVTRFGDDAILSGQNLLLTFRQIGKETFPRATEVMLDMSEAMGQDLKSSAIQLGKALNDPVTGLTALSRVGITFTDQQKDMIKAMQESGDIAGAQAVILAELENQFGGVARAAAGGTGVFDQLKELFGDISEIGGEVVSEFLIPAAQRLKVFLEQAIETGKVESIFRKIATRAESVATGIGNFTDQAAKLYDTLSPLIDFSLGAMATALDGIRVILGGIVQPLGFVVEQFGKLTGVGEEFGAKFKDFGKEQRLRGGLGLAESFSQATDGERGTEGISDSLIDETVDSVMAEDDKDPADKGVEKIQAGLPATEEEFEAIQERKKTQDEVLIEAEKENQDKLTSVFDKGNKDRTNIFDKNLKEQLSILSNKNATELQQTEATFGALNNLTKAFGVENNAITKGLGAAKIVMNTAKGVSEALASYPPPISYAYAGITAAMGAAELSTLRGAAAGGIVGGFDTGRDNQMMAVRSGEMIVPPDMVRPLTPTLRDLVRNEDERGIQAGDGGMQTVRIEFAGDASRLLREIQREGNYAQGLS